MRFRPLFALGVGVMVIAVPTDRGTSPEREDTVPGPNVVPAAVGCSLAVSRGRCCSQERPRLIRASSANGPFPRT